MYIVYEEHIEQLEKENEELEKKVLILRRKVEYYKTIVEEEEKWVEIQDYKNNQLFSIVRKWRKQRWFF